MKKLIALLVLAVGIASATERVNLTCKFDAIASGYVNKLYSANLILADDQFYNADGSSGNNGNAIFANEPNNDFIFSFQIYDGTEFHDLYANNGLKYDIPVTWALNTGEVTCTMTRGWGF